MPSNNSQSPISEYANARQARPAPAKGMARCVSTCEPDVQGQSQDNFSALPDDEMLHVNENATAKNWRDQIDALEIPDSVRPENSNRVLGFSTRQAAQEASFQRDNTWSSPASDPTIPTTDEERAHYTLRLVLAVENAVDTKNKRNHKKKWENLDATYSRDAIEKVCHDLVVCTSQLWSNKH